MILSSTSTGLRPEYEYDPSRRSGSRQDFRPIRRSGSRQDFRPIRRSGSRQDFRPIRFDLKLQTLASFGYGGVAPQPACLAGSKVLLGERVAPLRVVFPPDRRLRRRFWRECSAPTRLS
jgi:hypothetical protein